MKKILGIGNALVDILIPIGNDYILKELELPKGSMQHVTKERSNWIIEKLKYLKPSYAAGGSVANTMHGLGMLGAKCGFTGVVGEDEIGGSFVRDMLNAGVDLLMIHSRKETGSVVVLVTPDHERTFATHLGAAAEFTEEFIDGLRFEDYDLIHIEGFLVFNNNLVRQVAKKAKTAGIKASIDLASYNVVEANRDFLQEIVSNYIDIVFANEDEARAFTGLEPEQAIGAIASIAEIAVVKTGKSGSLIRCGSEFHKIGVIPAKPLDTTGAGDLYASGFLYGLSKGLPLKTCGEYGALLAGNVIEVIGSKMSRETWNNIRSKTAG